MTLDPPHGPVWVVAMPAGWWLTCVLCELLASASTPEGVRAFLGQHQVQPDPAWLARMERARVEVAGS
jgi:hypothetical protein